MEISKYMDDVESILLNLGIKKNVTSNPAFKRKIIPLILNLISRASTDVQKIDTYDKKNKEIYFVLSGTTNKNGFDILKGTSFYLSLLDNDTLVIKYSELKDDDTNYFRSDRLVTQLTINIETDNINIITLTSHATNSFDSELGIKEACTGDISTTINIYDRNGIEVYNEYKFFNDVYYGNSVDNITDIELLKLPLNVLNTSIDTLKPNYYISLKRIDFDIARVELIDSINNIDSTYNTVLNDEKGLADMELQTNSYNNALNSHEYYINPLSEEEILIKLMKEENAYTRLALKQLSANRTTKHYKIIESDEAYNKPIFFHIKQ